MRIIWNTNVNVVSLIWLKNLYFFGVFCSILRQCYYRIILWIGFVAQFIYIHLCTLVVEFLFPFQKLYYLKSSGNKKGLMFVGRPFLFCKGFSNSLKENPKFSNPLNQSIGCLCVRVYWTEKSKQQGNFFSENSNFKVEIF